MASLAANGRCRSSTSDLAEVPISLKPPCPCPDDGGMALWSHYVAVEVLTAGQDGEAPVDHSRGRAVPVARTLAGLMLAAIAAVTLLAGISARSAGTAEVAASASSPAGSANYLQFPTGPQHGHFATVRSVRSSRR